MIGVREHLTTIYRSPGPFSSVWIDISTDVNDPRRSYDVRVRNALQHLAEQGAPETDIEAVRAALDEVTGAPSPAARMLVVSAGELLLDQVYRGESYGTEFATFSTIPDCTPVLRHQPLDFRYIVVEAGRGGGEIRLYHLGAIGPDEAHPVEGRTDSLNKVQAGGWSHARYQRHSEDIWKHNEDELAERVDALVTEHHPRFIVVAGDVRAVQLLEEGLSKASREVLSVVSTDTHAPGASDSELDERIDELIDAARDREYQGALEMLRSRDAGEASTEALGIGEVVAALQQAQVALLMIGDAAWQRQLHALDAEPWVATEPDDRITAKSIAVADAPVVLTRAAVLTDARVSFVADDELPERMPVAATLRWPVGPGAPA
jgi:hypothetical protein